MAKRTWDTYEEWLDVRIAEAREKVEKLQAILYTEGGSAKPRDEVQYRLTAYMAARAALSAPYGEDCTVPITETAPSIPDTNEEMRIASAVSRTLARRGIQPGICDEAAHAAAAAYRNIARAKK